MSTLDQIMAAFEVHRPGYRTYQPGSWAELSCNGCDVFKDKRLSHLDWGPHEEHVREIVAGILGDKS